MRVRMLATWVGLLLLTLGVALLVFPHMQVSSAQQFVQPRPQPHIPALATYGALIVGVALLLVGRNARA